jgi:hypothetical protein
MDRIALECCLPRALDPIDQNNCTTPQFGGCAEHFFRVDQDGQLWRRTCTEQNECHFDWSGTLEVDTWVINDYARFTMTFVTGRVVAFGALMVARPVHGSPAPAAGECRLATDNPPAAAARPA